MALAVDWQNSTSVKVDQKAVETHLELILQRLGVVGRVGIEISLVGDRAIQKLNQEYRQIDRPTDVLSFANPDRSLLELPLGNLVISVETAARQAKKAGITVDEELKMISGHGLLHLLDYNHI